MWSSFCDLNDYCYCYFNSYSSSSWTVLGALKGEIYIDVSKFELLPSALLPY